MHIDLFLHVLLMLVVANGTPVITGLLFRERMAWPLDGGRQFIDGRRLFGASKTLRGIVMAVLASALLAPLIGLAPADGALTGLLAMTGDLVSSFSKRRLGYQHGCASPLLDQLPESCLPLWVLGPATGASLADMAAAVAAFTVLDLLVSRLYRPDQALCR